MNLTGTVNGRPSGQMLIDAGASLNFIDSSVAEKAGLPTRRLGQPVRVKLADGSQCRCESVVERAHIQTAEHSGHHDLVVMDRIDGFSLILGFPFLERARVVVDFENRSVVFKGAALERSTAELTPSLSKDAAVVSLSGPVVADVVTKGTALAQSPVSMTHPFAKGVAIARQFDPAVVDLNLVQIVADSRSAEHQDGLLALFHVGSQPDTASVSCESQRGRLGPLIAEYEAKLKPFDGQLPISRGDFDHQIVLKNPAVPPVKRKAIPLNVKEQAKLKETLDELEAAGLIKKSISAWAAPVFFVPKDHGASLRMVVDYRWLNAEIKRNSTSLPHVKELMARIGKSRVFSKLDLRSGYHQVRLRTSDTELSAFVTPFGHFEWLVMPFGEANAPATFIQLMTQLVLKDFVHSFVIGFMDDILIHSESEEQHVEHVRLVLEQLEKHRLFLKPSKCAWMVQEVEFLGFKITAGPAGPSISTTDNKVAAVKEWPTPKSVKDVRSFVGFVNYYREHIANFARMATPLTNLTKTDKKGKPVIFQWTANEQHAFDALKQALCAAPALAIPDLDKQFILHTDASDFAVGAVLSQLGTDAKLHPLGFMSRKLANSQLRWSTYEKELFAVISALQHWSMNLMGTKEPILVYTDHYSLQHLLKQPKLTGRQSRWLDLLSQFNLDMRYVEGTKNMAADALSRRSDHDEGAEARQHIVSAEAKEQLFRAPVSLMAARAASTVDSAVLLDEIRSAYANDPECLNLLRDPARYHYELRGGLLLRHPDSGIYVPNDKRIRTQLLYEAHDAATGGHFGANKTHAKLAQNFYWPRMARDVAQYVSTCTKCLANKSSNQRPAGLLQSIEPVCKGHTITLDFIGPVPTSTRGKNFILVIVDKFTKRAWYEPVKLSVTGRGVADVVFNRVVRHQGVPACIISDRDPRFTSGFWTALWEALGTRVALSTAYHPQSDGQTERQNRTLEESLRSYVNAKGSDWDQHLGACEIAYNSSVHASTKMTPFRLDGGIDAALPLDLLASIARPVQNTTVEEFLAVHEQNFMDAHRNIAVAQDRQAQYANRHRREYRYNVGDKAWLDAKDLNLGHGSRKLRAKFVGPFEVVGVSNDANVRLRLPDDWTIHNQFHVSRLKPHHESDDANFPDRDAQQLNVPQLLADVQDLDIVSPASGTAAANDGSLPDENVLATPSPSTPPDSPSSAAPSRTTRNSARSAWDRGGRYTFEALNSMMTEIAASNSQHRQ
jgi:RNase H-like domain found in reverse transcriptase/Reverse transcriptase (RNA-dependent DNA polymerase)/Integrase zinc binding domain/Retroviral aspartyl protease